MMTIVDGISWSFVLIFINIALIWKAEANYDDSLVTIDLFHNLGPSKEQFKARGSILVKTLKSGAPIIQQSELNTEDLKQLKNLVQDDDIYHIKAVIANNGKDQQSFLTFLKASSLINSKLSDVLTLSVDNSGNIVSVSAAVQNHPESSLLGKSKVQDLNTVVLVQQMENGPVPDTASYIQRIEQEKIQKERGETKDNRSFIAKYWMYIVPVVVLMLISSAANPEGGGGGGAGGR